MIVEHKNRSYEELAKTMLNETNLPKYLCVHVVRTTYDLNYELAFEEKSCHTSKLFQNLLDQVLRSYMITI